MAAGEDYVTARKCNRIVVRAEDGVKACAAGTLGTLGPRWRESFPVAVLNVPSATSTESKIRHKPQPP